MTERPTALTVLPKNIPAELKALRIWVCWRYEWDKSRQAWTKVPYVPFETRRAASTRESSWRSFQAAYNCYVERRDFFDGVFACLSEKDPYTGGDFDHSTDLARVPHTYAELSPSGNGIRFIGIGTIPSACKRPDGELYDRKRFLSITGHRLPDAPCAILPIQEALDALYEELKGTNKEARTGTPGNGNRAAHAASHPPEEWAEARRQQRLNISSLLGELNRKSVSNKTGKRDTMLAYVLREDYTGFHNKWPHVGIVRGDGAIDQSQIRAVMANSIKGRGFTFPQFVALMSHFYGVECLTKWGYNKQSVQEEFATLWHISRSPRAGEYQTRIAPVKRGRGSDHGALLDSAYQALVDHKAGAQAFITQQQLADALGINRRTAITLMQQLRDAGRITYVAMRSNAGIIVSFGGVINEKETSSNPEHSNGVNKEEELPAISAASIRSGVINENNELGVTDAQTDDTPPDMSAELEVGQPTSGMINENETSDELGSTDAESSMVAQNDKRENEAPLDIYITSTVSLSGDTITPQNIEQAVIAAFDELPKSRADERTGELKRWPVTNRRVVEAVCAACPGRWKAKAITFWADKVRKRRKAQTFRELESLKRDALEKKAAAARKRIARCEEKAKTAPMSEIRAWYASQARQLEGGAALLAWELGRRDGLDQARVDQEGYSQGEMSEMLEIVEKERKPANIQRVFLPTARPDTSGLVERLKALKSGSEETQL